SWRHPTRATLLAAGILATVTLLTTGVWYHSTIQAEKRRTETALGESRRQLVRLRVASGRHHLDDGDLYGALVWFTEAMKLELEGGDRSAEPIHRARIGSVLQQCPRLDYILFHDGSVRSGEFSPDGRYILTAGGNRKALVWDTRTGRPVVESGMAHGDVVTQA